MRMPFIMALSLLVENEKTIAQLYRRRLESARHDENAGNQAAGLHDDCVRHRHSEGRPQ
jgi:hypothetical protein